MKKQKVIVEVIMELQFPENVENLILGLPDWAAAPGVKTIADARAKLKDGSYHGVGPERTVQVAEALQRWREQS